MKKIAAIVAVDDDYGFGMKNALPWPNHSEDMHRFKTITTGSCVIMGRNTYESLGRILPKRKNIIVTTDESYSVTGAFVAHSLGEAIAMCDTEMSFVIGGSRLLEYAFPIIDELYITRIHGNFPCDVKLSVDTTSMRLHSSERFGPDDKNPYPMTFQHYVRI